MNQYTEEMYECDNCGNVWDGNAQCLCGMMESDDESVDSNQSIVFDDDMASVSSDASDMLAEFEETGHIPHATTRESIKQMLAIARSQANDDEQPEWMDETRDYLTNGEFVDGKYQITAYLTTTPVQVSSKILQSIYPMLTDEECHQFSMQLEGGMYIDDIVDGFNIKRLRDYETARVNQLHWPHWAHGNVPTLELVKMRGE